MVGPYELDVEDFCALRVGGKSGSWDHAHSPESGKLFTAIRSSRSKKPRLWIADKRHALREIWREIEPHEREFYGKMSYFAAKWDI